MSLPVAFQVAVVTTATAQQLPSNLITQGLLMLAAKSGNAANIAIGTSSSVTATTGYLLESGNSAQINLHGSNTNELWIIGTAADVLSVLGN